MQLVFSPHDETHCTLTISRSPKSSNMSCHTTILEIFYTLIISLVLVPKRKTRKTLKPFLILLAQQKFKCRDSYDPTILIKFYP